MYILFLEKHSFQSSESSENFVFLTNLTLYIDDYFIKMKL